MYGDDYIRNSMSVITPRSSAKFNHSISLIFSGFLESHDHPRDPVRWSLIHVREKIEKLINRVFPDINLYISL